jgi:hypothetical protein
MTNPYGGRGYPTEFDPKADRTSQIPVTATIKEIYPRVMAEKPDTVDTAADGWTVIEKHLSATSGDLDKHHEKLKPQWTSDAATLFYGWIDSTKSSLANWQQTAKANAATLHTLAGSIRKLQSHMVDIWNEFDKKIAAAETEEHKSQALWENPKRWAEGLKEGWTGRTLLDPVVEAYTKRTISEVLNPLNEAFMDAFVAIDSGLRFTGPTKAVEPTPQQYAAALGVPGHRPGSPGAPPAPLGAVPPAPPAPLTGLEPPIAPLPPATLPAGLAPSALPGLSALHQPPAPLGVPPSGIVAALGLGSAGIAPLGVRPGGTAPKGAAPASFGEPGPVGGGAPSQPGAAEMPRGLQGRGAGGASNFMGEPPPGSGMRTPPPQFPGRGGGGRGAPQSPRSGLPRGEMPEMPPPARGRPALPGRNSRKPGQFDEADPMRPRAPGGDLPTNPGRFGTPRSLRGIRDPNTGIRPGSAEAEELPLRRLPTLDGRVGPAADVAEEELESTLQALRRGLGGRGTLRPDGPGEFDLTKSREASKAPAQPAASRDGEIAAKNGAASSNDFVGDSELFTPEESVPAVIERSAEPKPVGRDDPTLRPGSADRSLA